jgi:predicted DNA-binding transcriptional regulator AlpA
LKDRERRSTFQRGYTLLESYSMVEALLTETQISEIIGRSVPTLQKDRVFGTGPSFVKIGRQVRYRPEDVRAWLAERVRHSTSESCAEVAK